MQAAKLLVLCILIWRPACLPILLQTRELPRGEGIHAHQSFCFGSWKSFLGLSIPWGLSSVGQTVGDTFCTTRKETNRMSEALAAKAAYHTSNQPNITSRPCRKSQQPEQPWRLRMYLSAVNFFRYTIRKTTCCCFFFCF